MRNGLFEFYVFRSMRQGLFSVVLFSSLIGQASADCDPRADTACGCRRPDAGEQVCISNEVKCVGCASGWRQRACLEACSTSTSNAKSDESGGGQSTGLNLTNSQRRAQRLSDAADALAGITAGFGGSSGSACIAQQSRCLRACGKGDHSCPAICSHEATKCVDKLDPDDE